jgi:hypothetical protein
MKDLLKISFILLLFLQIGITGCQQAATGTEDKIQTTGGEEFVGQSFGEGITSSSYADMSEVLGQLKESEEVTTTMKAKVSEVCQAKGCWMTLTDSKTNEEFMVKFYDYGFFVPKDISGKEVIVEGKAFKEVTPVDELRHYAEDAGKSADEIAAITEPKAEWKFEATGVLVLDN